jgi:RNA polymerase sigma factor (sigma-70 family)
MLEPSEQARLVDAASAGDEGAWSQLVDAFSGLVWSVLRANGVYGADAADAFQTVWLRCVEHLDRLRDPGSLAAWLATTARHETYRITRKAARAAAVIDIPDVADVRVDDPGETLAHQEELRAYRHALAQVSAQCQELLRLLALDPPLSYDELAGVTGMPKGSIGPTRARCLERVKRIMVEGGRAA